MHPRTCVWALEISSYSFSVNREPFKDVRKYSRYHCENDEVAAVACDTSSGIAKAGVAGDRCHTVFPSRQVAEGGDSIDLVWHGGRQK